MTERAPTRRRAKAPANSPINFRMPNGLRSRLRRFAEERNLGEAEGLRLALSERLDQADDDRELAIAERWQFEQAYKTWKEDQRTGGRHRVPWSSIERTFRQTLADVQSRQRTRK